MPETRTPLIFHREAVRKILAHSVRSPERNPTYDQCCDPAFHRPTITVDPGEAATIEQIDRGTIPAGLWLVKDEGIYLMSNGYPDLVDRKGARRVVYANPPFCANHPDYSWDACRAAMGGDDGAYFLDLPFVGAVLRQKTSRFVCIAAIRGTDGVLDRFVIPNVKETRP